MSHDSCRADVLAASLLVMMFAAWVNRHQLDAIDYLREENRVLKERLGARRIRFTDAEPAASRRQPAQHQVKEIWRKGRVRCAGALVLHEAADDRASRGCGPD